MNQVPLPGIFSVLNCRDVDVVKENVKNPGIHKAFFTFSFIDVKACCGAYLAYVFKVKISAAFSCATQANFHQNHCRHSLQYLLFATTDAFTQISQATDVLYAEPFILFPPCTHCDYCMATLNVSQDRLGIVFHVDRKNKKNA